ncbi:unnamed protein product [Owenia fusiformis]|uniref:Uncharacterized protein n=1 Tax=Owenia fusiformis TaxID=6347 RepID=A0A8J1TT54_OWEFU|nr:unnamed protein product [Owenia fusiformis]
MADFGYLSNNTTMDVTFDMHQNYSNSTQLPTPPYWDPIATIILSVLMIIFIILTVPGNMMVLIVLMKHKGMRTRTNLFLGNLAIADLAVGLLNMPFSLTTVIKGHWIFGDVLCKINGFVMPLFFVTSIHTLMYISVHKYITILKPFSQVMTTCRILMMIGATWLWGGMIGFTTLYAMNKVIYKPFATQCGPEYPHDLITYIHAILTSGTGILIPFIVMTVTYICIFREIKRYGVRLEKNTNQEKATILAQQKRITMTLFIVVACFVVCWLPYFLYSIYASIIKDKSKIPHNLNAIVYWAGYFNSCLNPIIYAFRSPAFREGYKDIMFSKSSYQLTDDTLMDSSSHLFKRFGTLLRKSFSRTTITSSNGSSLHNSSFRHVGHRPRAPFLHHKYRTASLPALVIEKGRNSVLVHDQGKPYRKASQIVGRNAPTQMSGHVSPNVYYPNQLELEPLRGVAKKSDDMNDIALDEVLVDNVHADVHEDHTFALMGQGDQVSISTGDSSVFQREKSNSNIVDTECGIYNSDLFIQPTEATDNQNSQKPKGRSNSLFKNISYRLQRHFSYDVASSKPQKPVLFSYSDGSSDENILQDNKDHEMEVINGRRKLKSESDLNSARPCDILSISIENLDIPCNLRKKSNKTSEPSSNGTLKSKNRKNHHQKLRKTQSEAYEHETLAPLRMLHSVECLNSDSVRDYEMVDNSDLIDSE